MVNAIVLSFPYLFSDRKNTNKSQNTATFPAKIPAIGHLTQSREVTAEIKQGCSPQGREPLNGCRMDGNPLRKKMRLPQCDSPTATHIKTRRDAPWHVSTILIQELQMASGTLANR